MYRFPRRWKLFLLTAWKRLFFVSIDTTRDTWRTAYCCIFTLSWCPDAFNEPELGRTDAFKSEGTWEMRVDRTSSFKAWIPYNIRFSRQDTFQSFSVSHWANCHWLAGCPVQGFTHQNQLVLELAPIKSQKYRTNSQRPVREPSGAWIPGPALMKTGKTDFLILEVLSLRACASNNWRSELLSKTFNLLKIFEIIFQSS